MVPGASVHHLHLWFTISWTEEYETHGVGGAAIIMTQTTGVDDVSWLVVRKIVSQLLKILQIFQQLIHHYSLTLPVHLHYQGTDDNIFLGS